MTLGYARAAVHHLIAYCLNGSCRQQAIIDVSGYPPKPTCIKEI
jgi:hypothetical protein